MNRVETCPGGGSKDLEVFHRVRAIPTNSCIQLTSAEEAKNYPKGDIELGYCRDCEFISNRAFDPALTEYSSRYEETQAFSETFNRFHRTLARDLVERHQLKNKRIIEIGCGKGEFLELLCELGENEGVGFDLGFDPGRLQGRPTAGIEFVRDFFSEAYSHYLSDFVCCKMTLEHISDTRNFVEVTRRSIGDRRDTVVFFQVPNADRILTQCAFEDIYYEHCSYFTSSSLAGLFERCGFRVLDVRFGEQYLSVEAVPVESARRVPYCVKRRSVQAKVADFSTRMIAKRRHWNEVVGKALDDGKRIALWGAGSKAVSFLHTIDRGVEIPLAVDINPHRQGHFMAGTAQRIVGPQALEITPPDLIIVMNRIYLDEVRQELADRSLAPHLCAL